MAYSSHSAFPFSTRTTPHDFYSDDVKINTKTKWWRCRRLANQPVASEPERARNQCLRAAVTPQVNLSFSFVSHVFRHLIYFIAEYSFSEWLTVFCLAVFTLFTDLISNSNCLQTQTVYKLKPWHRDPVAWVTWTTKRCGRCSEIPRPEYDLKVWRTLTFRRNGRRSTKLAAGSQWRKCGVQW